MSGWGSSLIFRNLPGLLRIQENPPVGGSTPAEPTLPADGLIRAIQGPRELASPALEPWMLAAGILLLLAALLALVLLRRRRSRPLAAAPSPYQIARNALLETFDQRDPENPKAFAVGLSHAVRNFIEQAFHMPAPERTTEEFLPQVQQHPVFHGELSEKLGDFLALCDLAKFARHRFGDEELNRLYHLAEAIIDQSHLRLLQAEQPAGEEPVDAGSPPQNGKAAS